MSPVAKRASARRSGDATSPRPVYRRQYRPAVALLKAARKRVPARSVRHQCNPRVSRAFSAFPTCRAESIHTASTFRPECLRRPSPGILLQNRAGPSCFMRRRKTAQNTRLQIPCSTICSDPHEPKSGGTPAFSQTGSLIAARENFNVSITSTAHYRRFRQPHRASLR
jgi:hypothetical protein